MPRILVYDHLDQPLFELDPNKVYGLKMVEKVNDEHSLTITTSHELEKGQRIFYHDGEKLREFVVLGDVASHADGFQHEYYCVWSLQYDLSAAYIDDRRIGNKNNLVPASDILTVIAGQSRWQVGTVTTTTVSSAWLYYKSLWEALGIVVENWQGEVDSTIVLSDPVARYIDFKAHVGSSEAKRRFDYGHDLTSIKRTVLDDLYVCRIVPRGKGEAVEGEGGEVSGYGRRITIESVNPTGEEWIQDDSVVPLVRVPNGSGGYEYPTSIVIFDSIETPQVLYDTAMAELETYTRPKMSYEASVLALSGAGMDVEGVSLGDTVHVVDTTFGEDGLRLSARVLGIERDLLEPSNDKLTIGNFQPKMSDTVKDLIDGLSAAQEQLIDTDAKADSAISDASEAAQIAVEAQTVANAINQHFWVDTDGAHVTEVTKDEWNDTTGSRYHTGSNSLWNSLGMLFRKGLTNLLAIVTSNTGGNVTGVSIYDGQGNGSNNIVALFGSSGFQVGRTRESHLIGDYHSMKLVDKDGSSYFDVADLRDESGNATITDSFAGDGTTAIFYLGITAASTSYTVKRNGTTVTSGITKTTTSFTFSTAPASGASITATYTVTSQNAKYYTLGTRGSGNVGGMSVSEGSGCVASGFLSHAEGDGTTASGYYTHAENSGTTASGNESHAEGLNTKATGRGAHAEGYITTASGQYSHGEGRTTASGDYSHSEGRNTTASGDYSHAEGYSTTASDDQSHAEGNATVASGISSHAQNWGTVAASQHQTAMGRFNVSDSNQTYALIIGNGTSTSARSNAMTVDWSGNETLAGGLTLGSPLTIANGGTGATTAEGARSNLNVVGASDQSRQNARFITYAGADQIYGLYATCINANNTDFNGKNVGVIFRDGGISLYNGTDNNFPWQISGLSGTVNLGVTTPTFTANTTNWTASETYVKRSGRVVSVSLAGQAKAGVGTWQTNTYHIGTLSAHPSATKLFTAVAQISSAFTAFIGKIDTNGKIYLRTAGTAIPANSYVWLDCTFICS